MKLSEWLKEEPSRTGKLAAHMGKTPGCIRHWSRSARQLDAEYAPLIEGFANGSVTCEELRPDLDWVRVNGVVTHYQVRVGHGSPANEQARAA